MTTIKQRHDKLADTLSRVRAATNVDVQMIHVVGSGYNGYRLVVHGADGQPLQTLLGPVTMASLEKHVAGMELAVEHLIPRRQ